MNSNNHFYVVVDLMLSPIFRRSVRYNRAYCTFYGMVPIYDRMDCRITLVICGLFCQYIT